MHLNLKNIFLVCCLLNAVQMFFEENRERLIREFIEVGHSEEEAQEAAKLKDFYKGSFWVP